MRATFTAFCLSLALLLALAGCSAKPPVPPTPIAPGNYSATIQTDMGNIDIQLFADKAPLAVGNFVGLAEGTMRWRDPATQKVKVNKPFYDGLIFHRVIAGFMIQGGDPLGDGTGDPGYTFANEVSPDLKFDQPGRVGMANSGPNSNGSQFFITVAPQPQLDGQYTLFGQVTGGMDVVTAISNLPRDAKDKPVKPVHIQKVTIHRG